jgi:transposase
MMIQFTIVSTNGFTFGKARTTITERYSKNTFKEGELKRMWHVTRHTTQHGAIKGKT